MRTVSCLLAVALFGCSEPEAEPTRADAGEVNVLLAGAPLLIAHRGGGALAPEETLEAFASAEALGADVLELDVHSSADGEIVCLHDDTVDRTTDGTGAVTSLTLAQLAALDAGYRFTPDGGRTFPFRGQGVRVATLESVLRAHPRAWFSIEIKQTEPDLVDPVIGVLDATGMAGRVVVVAFSDATVTAVRARRPDILTGMGLGEMTRFNALTDETEADYAPPTRIVQPPSAAVTSEVVSRADRLGLRLHAWTVNDEPEMTRLLDLGVHGIMTDDPGLLAALLARR